MEKELNLNIDQFSVSPFYSVISFHKVIDTLVEIAKEKDAPYRAIYAQSLLNEVAKVPELYNGITSKKTIYDNLDLIHNLLADLFPTALTYNEIKAVSLPFQNFNFNFTKRFQNIIQDAGEEFEINIRDFTNDQYYIFSCCLILNTYYGQNFDLSRPLFYDIPDKNGIIRHYRIIYNGDFCELIPTETAPEISDDDIKLLKRSFDNIDIWKEKFPQHSWILKGFGILSLFDATIENTISNIKSNLLRANQDTVGVSVAQNTFKSIFRLKNINFGIFFVNNVLNNFVDLPTRVEFESVFDLTNKKVSKEVKNASKSFLQKIAHLEGYYCVTDVLELYDDEELHPYLDYLQTQGVRSFILAPIRKNDGFQPYIEIYSEVPYALHSINANKLNDVMPLLNDTFERYYHDIKNELDAIIQREYTTIHPSVNWKFQEQAKNAFFVASKNENYILKEIEFQNVMPLFGETDIQSSTSLRNHSILQDLKKQLKDVLSIFESIYALNNHIVFQQRIDEILFFTEQLKTSEFLVESKINRYIVDDIHPILNKFSEHESLKDKIQKYKEKLDVKTERYSKQIDKYNVCVQKINKNLTNIIDVEQDVIQKIYPHYFERFRTDGVEHNLYIGASISPNQNFDVMYLYNLRLWQLQVICKMILSHVQLKETLDFDMNLTSLILVYNDAVSIKFRMDEKRFDVDGTEGIRYEMLKKRLTKATINHSEERLVKANVLTIVYLSDKEKGEYLNYIKFLQAKRYLGKTIEFVTIDNLQDLTNLQAIRVPINVDCNLDEFKIFKYTDYVNSFNSIL